MTGELASKPMFDGGFVHLFCLVKADGNDTGNHSTKDIPLSLTGTAGFPAIDRM